MEAISLSLNISDQIWKESKSSLKIRKLFLANNWLVNILFSMISFFLQSFVVNPILKYKSLHYLQESTEKICSYKKRLYFQIFSLLWLCLSKRRSYIVANLFWARSNQKFCFHPLDFWINVALSLMPIHPDSKWWRLDPLSTIVPIHVPC